MQISVLKLDAEAQQKQSGPAEKAEKAARKMSASIAKTAQIHPSLVL